MSTTSCSSRQDQAILGAREAAQQARALPSLTRRRKWLLITGCVVPALAITAFS